MLLTNELNHHRVLHLRTALNRKILIIDSDRSSCARSSVILAEAGFTCVQEAQSLDQALRIVEEEKVDTVITELKFDANLNLVSYIKAIDPLLPVIVINGKNDSAQAIDAMREGATDSIEKPFEGFTLILCVTRALNKRAHDLKTRHGEESTSARARDVLHDLRNPLSIVKVQADMLDEDCDTLVSKTVAEMGRSITQAVGRIEEIANSLLSGGAGHSHETLEIGRLVERCVSVCTIEKKTSAVQVEIIKPSKALYVNCAKGLLMRSIVNLIENAVDAALVGDTPKVWLLIDSVAIENDKKIQISVVDNGPGISCQAKLKLFIRGFTTKSQGSGIGLQISRENIRDMGGDLFYNDKPGPTQFCIVLPCLNL